MFKSKFSSQFLLILLISYGCNEHLRNKKENYCVGEIWYEIAKTANPDLVKCTIDVADSSLFYYFVNFGDRLKIDFHGALYEVDSFHVMYHVILPNNIDYTLVIAQSTSPLTKYEKPFLDSIIQKTNAALRIEITDTLTQKKWEFSKCEKTDNKDKEWFKNVSKWLH